MNFQNNDFFNMNNQSCCPNACPTYQQCNQVVQTCNVENVPHYVGYHTHVVNNCIKKHINIPVYSTSAENVYIDEYVEGTPVYYGNQPYGQQGYVQPGYTQPGYAQPGATQNPDMSQYQGNVGTNPQNVANGFANPGFTNPAGFNPFGY